MVDYEGLCHRVSTVQPAGTIESYRFDDFLDLRKHLIAILFIVVLLTPTIWPDRPAGRVGSASAAATSLELHGNFHTMGVIVTIDPVDDPDADAQASVAYRTGPGPFQLGFPLTRVSGGQFTGSLFWLEPGTVYDIEVTLSDPDAGPLDGLTLAASDSTRADPVIPPPVNTLYAAPGGSGTACSLALPCSLTESLNQAQPGDEVLLRGGVYFEGEIYLPRGGTPGSPIVIRSFGSESAVLDGADPTTFSWSDAGGGVYTTTINVANPWLVAANGERLFPYPTRTALENLNWGLPGFFAEGTTLYVHLLGGADPAASSMKISRFDFGIYVNRDFIYLSNLTFRHYGRDRYAKAIFLSGGSDVLVQNSTFALNNQGINIKHAAHRNLISGNEFYDTIFDWSWDAVKQDAPFLEPGGVYINEPMTGRGNVIRDNTFHDLFDGFHTCPITTTAQTSETDVHGNLVYRTGDDGMETDGRCTNVRIWENRFHDVLTGISMSPVDGGPVYALRNVIYRFGAGNNNHQGVPFKFIYGLSSDGAVYLFHNTGDAVLADNAGFSVGGEPGTWNQIVSRNNIWSGTEYAINKAEPAQSLDIDYDDLYTSWAGPLAWWAGLPDPNVASLGDLQSQTGQELNGWNVLPNFQSPANGDYTLQAASPLIDEGLVLPGVNDIGPHAYLGTAPDIGAYESPLPTATPTSPPTGTPTSTSTPFASMTPTPTSIATLVPVSLPIVLR